MGGEESEKAEEEEEEEEEEEPFPGVSLVDAPILLLVLFHKAQRAELADLRRLAAESGSQGRDLVVDLCRRFEFLKLVCKYHSAAEDEVIFQALDIHIKNVVCAYSLEHTNINELFDSVFKCLNVLKTEDGDISKPFQELVSSIGTIQTTICQHMLKEEEQVFPLLMKNFSSKEQGSLVWQVMCSVPIMLLEDVLPWMTSFLSPDEIVDVTHCIKEVVPKEKLLQEVVISWLDSKERSAFGAYPKYGKEGQFPDGLNNLKDTLKVHASKNISEGEFQLKKEYSIHKTGRHNPIDGIHLWHGAINKDLKEIMEELRQISSTNSFSTFAEVIVQLKFFADVLIFYRNASDKIFYPLWNELAKDIPSLFCERLLDESGIESLQRLLYYKTHNGLPSSNFVDKLHRELELFVREIGKLLNYLETEVFPTIIKNCSHEMQQWILYKSLHMIPLGLLKCMITWFSAHLSEDESNSILYNIKQGSHLTNKSFASILYEWVRIGYSGKTSVDKFRKGLRDMFSSRVSFLPEQIKNSSGFSYSKSDMEPSNRYNPGPSEQSSASMAMNYLSSSGSNTTWKYDMSYSSGINMHIFFPQTLKKFSSLSESSDSSSFLNFESKPVDFIFFFHKALKKDLEHLVHVSAKLGENVGFLGDFNQRFHLVQFLYQIHSDSEDVIAFPALEAKGKLQNISHSYTIDHKLEVKLFNKISRVIDEISGLKISVPKSNLDLLGPIMIKYHQLCTKLHDLCKSMNKILIDHVQREEIELWPLFRECFSIQEQEKIIGRMLGRTRAEILQKMIPWLMASLTPEEKNSLMSLWRKVTRNTMFEEWLREWWEGMKSYHTAVLTEESNILPSWTADPLEVISTYLMKEGIDDQGGNLGNEDIKISQKKIPCIEPSRNHNVDDKAKVFKRDNNNQQYSDCTPFSGEVPNKNCNEVADVTDQADKTGQLVRVSQKFCDQEKLLMLSQDELEAAIRRVSRDSTLDLQKKSYIIQNLLTSRWFVTQQKSHPEVTVSSNKEKVPSQSPSYRDPLKSIFGCKHYKRNCKFVFPCCGELYTCIRCHDDMANHSMDRKSITKMMCMKCLTIQLIAPTCSTGFCHNFSMARYYCRICKLFDDEREIYHCPYCNLCRVGKGLGMDYFHCMNCNACMSRSLSMHFCREKCFEDNCPICHEYIFTSCAPVKALPCGHLMHSACFQDYTYIHYTCPICSKSLGDMQVYFGMLDALLAEEKIPEEYSGQTQVILCNDCEKRGTASFHWFHHKCSSCGSYNTRLL